MFCNTATAKDLNGIKLYCSFSNFHNFGINAAIVFVRNHRAILSIMFVEYTNMPTDGTVTKLMLEKTFEYKVEEDEIIISSGSSPDWRDTRLNRENLWLYGFGKYVLPSCEIVDYDSLEKFKENLKKIQTKKEKNKI